MNFTEYLDMMIKTFSTAFTYLPEGSLDEVPFPEDLTPFYKQLRALEYCATEFLDSKTLNEYFTAEETTYAKKYLKTSVSNRNEEQNREVLKLCIAIFKNDYTSATPVPESDMNRYNQLVQMPVKSRSEAETQELGALAIQITKGKGPHFKPKETKNKKD